MSLAVRHPAATASDETLLLWRVHRLRDHPERLVLVVLGYVVTTLFWRLSLPHPLLLVSSLLILTASLSDYLFPITYRLTTQGAHADGILTRFFLEWKEVKRASYGQDGIFLSPLPRPSRLDHFRGVRLLYGKESPDELRMIVKRCWKGDAE